MKSALALLLALVGLAGLVALSCTAPLSGAPCDCLPGYECDEVADVCRPIGGDASGLAPADAHVPSDAGDTDGAVNPSDSGGGSADAGAADASVGGADADPFTPDADL